MKPELATSFPYPSNSEAPIVSIVMPVRNEEHFIVDTLTQLLRQDYPSDRFEILVADGMSDDRTREIVADIATKHPHVRLLDNPGRRSSSGRNVGFKQGRGDIFLVVDGHCYIPDDQLLKNTAGLIQTHQVDCLGRPQPLDPPGLSNFQQAVALARSSRLGHGGDSLIFGDYEGYASPISNGAAYTRRVFEKTGYVDETFDAAEDVEFNYRVEQAGFKCFTSPKLTIRYYPRPNVSTLFRQMTRYGKGRRNFTCKHPEALTLNQLIPTGFLCGLAFLLTLLLLDLFFSAFPSSLRTYVTTPLLLLYLFYLVMIFAESIRVAMREGWQHLRYLPLIFITIHSGLGWGFLKAVVQGLTNSQNDTTY